MDHPLAFESTPPLTHDLTISHFKCEGEPQKPHHLTIPEVMVKTCTENANKELFIFRAPESPRLTITGNQLLDKSEYVASRLIEAGIELGDRIGLLGPNSPEYVFAEYGIVRAGAGAVRMHSMFKSGQDLLHIMNKTECKCIIVIPGQSNEYLGLVRLMFPVITKLDAEAPLKMDYVPSMEFVMVVSSKANHPGMRRIDLDLSGPSTTPDQSRLVEARQKDIKPEDICWFYLTSGTTGFPKVVAMSHFHMVNYTFSGSGFAIVGDIVMKGRPFSHIGGTTVQGALRGIVGVYLDPKTAGNMDFFFRIMEEERATSTFILPYMLNDLVKHLEGTQYDLSSLKKGIVAGQCVPRKSLEKCLELVPGIMNGYGTTEAGPALAGTLSTDPTHLKLDFTGYPLPLTEFKIEDEKGHIVPVNTPGMLYVRTPLMFVCYWGDEAKTREARDEEGWYRTDDMAVMNERGYLNILGRKTEVIIKAGIKVYPVVIEKFLIDHSKIARVSVVGVPDERLVEEVCACIVAVPGSGLTVEELEAYCDENLLTDGSAIGLGLRPKYFLLWETLPLTMGQKIDKKAMKELAMKEIGLN